MLQHPNARLTPRGRRMLVERVGAGRSVSSAAREAGVSRQTAHKWLARARAGEPLEDRSRVAYAGLLADGRRGTYVAFVSRARDFFRDLGVEIEGVMTDNGPGYRSRHFNGWLEAAGVRHVYTRPHGPWRNGKVERMNQTLAREWQYARAYAGEAGRARALPAYIECYNRHRPHSACGGLPPMSRIDGVSNVMAHNS